MTAWILAALCPASPSAADSHEEARAGAAEAAPTDAASGVAAEAEPAPPPPAEDSPVLEEEREAAGPEKAVKPHWTPPPPDPEGDDWIRTTSGEWLKGELTRMRDRKFEFDSDEFDDVKVDQEDVAYFRFSRPHTFRFRGREIFRGTGQLRNGVIKVRTMDGEIVERDAELLVSVSRGAGNELDRWTVDLSVGLTARQGNTDQADISGRAEIERETAFNRWSTHYSGAWARVEGDKTANNHRLYTELDFYLTWRFYLTLPFLEFFTDEFQNIEARYTPGIGLGYEIVDSSRVEWEVSSGLAYQRTVFDSGASSSNDAAIIFGMDLDLEITKDLDFDNSYGLQLVATDLDKTNHHLESVFSFDIWGPIDFDVTFVWDRIESPEEEGDGSTPKSDDFRMTIGLAIDF